MDPVHLFIGGGGGSYKSGEWMKVEKTNTRTEIGVPRIILYTFLIKTSATGKINEASI